MTGSRFTPSDILNQTKPNQGILVSEQGSFGYTHLFTKRIYGWPDDIFFFMTISK